MKKFLSLLFLSLISFLISHICLAQEDEMKKYIPNVFVDCDFCDMNFFRTKINFANFTRERREAQVYILVTRQTTGSGGQEFSFTFSGQKQYQGMNDTLVYAAKPGDSDDIIRTQMAQYIRAGLVRYVAKTPVVSEMLIDYENDYSVKSDNETADTTKNETAKDKWNYWVFNTNLGGWFNGQAAVKEMNLWSSLEARRITDKWKQEYILSGEYYQGNFTVGNTVVQSLIFSESFDALVVKSLNDNFSAGGFANINSSTFNNIKYSYSFLPALEYNYFPYYQSTRSQLRFLYRAGYVKNLYIDTTIYNEINQDLYWQSLVIALELVQKWGSVSTSLRGSNYFHDFNKNRAELLTRLRFNIVRGLTFDLRARIQLIHDQLSLPKGGASGEEILLKQKLLATQYQYQGFFNISYTFGALNNNVVNPRFNL